MCWLGTTGYAKHGFPVLFFFVSPLFSVSFGKKRDGTIEKATLQCLFVFTGPRHFVLSQGVHAISEVRPKT
jgi:hypothetical protein